MSISKILFLTTCVAICVLSGQGNLYAKQVVVITTAKDDAKETNRIRSVADFYGVTTTVLVLKNGSVDQQKLMNVVANRDTLAVALTPEAVRFVKKELLFKATHRTADRNVPLLIAGINKATDPELLRQWSGGAIVDCQTMKTGGRTTYEVGRIEGITDQLSGADLPVVSENIDYLSVAGRNQPILSGKIDGKLWPVFVRVQSGSQELFFLGNGPQMNVYPSSNPFRESWVFGNLAAEIIFVKYAGRQFVWHAPNHYANLTIDDLWLREPYGNVEYGALLKEMQYHNFHTTIAFIPWNFDRSDPEVVRLFRSHSERFSICVHGNNHDHKEFDTYDIKPVGVQIANVAQSLARMEKFSQLTGIPYDRVMVFPHSIAPEPTLAALKQYNFIATANSQNVPVGAEAPQDFQFELRPATLHFADFPSLRRYSAEAPIPQSELAIDAFLGNPMLFYVHQGFFASGMNAFDETADRVNATQPDTMWRSLGEIAEHLYLQKERADGNFDVRAFSADLRLDNPSLRDRVAFVDKEEDFGLPFVVLVDGISYSYERLGNHILVRIPLPKRTRAHMTIRYSGALDITKVDVSKSSLRVRILRDLSDFRDDTISRSALGRNFIAEYTDSEGAWNRAVAASVMIILITATTWHFRRKIRREKKDRAAHAVQSIH